MKKSVLAMFVIGAIAIGLLVLLLIGALSVDEDGRRTGSGEPRTTAPHGAGYHG
jgi:hypothetical protein